jgi:SAM-dependent methyltransferase
MSYVDDKAFYDLRWRTSIVTERERNRVAATVAAIPDGCQSILDVGAGDGMLAHAAAATGRSVTAVDISQVALSRLRVPTFQRSADSLTGIEDRSYDLVLCSEMLEHLEDETYRGALLEFNRVARQAILITVPNRELLREHMGACGACGARFHIWGHRRRFTPADLDSLFPDFEPSWIAPFGDKLPQYNRPILWLRTAVANAWFLDERSPCPECHSFRPLQPAYPRIAALCDLTNSNLPKLRRSPWLMALYKRMSVPS